MQLDTRNTILKAEEGGAHASIDMKKASAALEAVCLYRYACRRDVAQTGRMRHCWAAWARCMTTEADPPDCEQLDYPMAMSVLASGRSPVVPGPCTSNGGLPGSENVSFRPAVLIMLQDSQSGTYLMDRFKADSIKWPYY